MAFKLKSSGGGLESLSLVGKLAIGTVFFVLVGVAYFVIFYGEVESEISTEQQRLTGLQTELQEAKSARDAFNKDLAELNRRKELQRKQMKILPDKAETPAFLSTIQNVATISGVQLQSWTPLDESLEQFYARVPMQLKLAGKYHQIAKFFYGVGQVDRIINMENITIKLQEMRGQRKQPGDEQSPTTERAVLIDVECLATAFRAVEASGRRADKKKKTGRRQPKGGAK